MATGIFRRSVWRRYVRGRGRILRPVIRDVGRKPRRVSDGESSQFAGIGTKTTLTSAQLMRSCAGRYNGPSSSLGLSHFQVRGRRRDGRISRLALPWLQRRRVANTTRAPPLQKNAMAGNKSKSSLIECQPVDSLSANEAHSRELTYLGVS